MAFRQYADAAVRCALHLDGPEMRLACRMFLLDRDDTLYRMPASTFERMLRDPQGHPLTEFAGARVRMSDVAVELADGRPVRVVWSTFDILAFDGACRFDAQAYLRHQRACAELGIAQPIAGTGCGGTVVDAATRFVVQGGCWLPSPALKRVIGAAALGHVKCRRIGFAAQAATPKGLAQCR